MVVVRQSRFKTCFFWGQVLSFPSFITPFKHPLTPTARSGCGHYSIVDGYRYVYTYIRTYIHPPTHPSFQNHKSARTFTVHLLMKWPRTRRPISFYVPLFIIAYLTVFLFRKNGSTASFSTIWRGKQCRSSSIASYLEDLI
jgi:hypothetical protein